MISVSSGDLGSGNIGLSADLIGDLDGNLLADRDSDLLANRDGNLLADRSGDLPGVLLGDLVALLLNMLLALGSAGVSISRLSISLSLSLAVSTISSSNDLGVVSNNSAGAVDLLAGLLAVLGHDVLALLDVGSVDDGVVLLMALLVILGGALLVVLGGALLVVLGGVLGGAVLLVVAIVVGTTVSSWGGHGSGGKASKGNKSQHLGLKV